MSGRKRAARASSLWQLWAPAAMFERPPDIAQFACPKCGAELVSETAGGAIVAKPPTCSALHPSTEMEQVYLGADAFGSEEVER